MHMCISSIRGDPMPASLQGNGVPVTRSVIPVLVQPVPAVSHEIGVKADHHLPIGCLLLSYPIEHCVERAFAGSWCQNTSTAGWGKECQSTWSKINQDAFLSVATRWCCSHVPYSCCIAFLSIQPISKVDSWGR